MDEEGQRMDCPMHESLHLIPPDFRPVVLNGLSAGAVIWTA
jgi:hypothetical protein